MINKIIKVNSKYKERVKSFIVKKKLYIKPNFPAIFVENHIAWKVQKELSKTEEVYLNSLLIIKDLIHYKLTVGKDYSEIACEIIENWWENNKDCKLVWNEHAVAERTLNILYFQENSSKKINSKLFNTILDKHLYYLYSSENYKNNNHGLMMDRSLLIGSYYIGNTTYRERAIDRFNVFIYRDFSTSGIHLENSPEYHSLAVKISKEFIDLLNMMKIEVNSDIDSIIKKAELYIPRLTRPDGYLPLLGDSGIKKLAGNKLYGNIQDHTSGVFLYQDYKFQNWLLSSNGYQKKTHKHKDDMSIQFSVNKDNFLVDSGKYNYDSNSEIRKYLISDKAHSKPFILERRFRYDRNHRLKTNIIYNTDDIYHIEMSYHKSKDFQILRNIILHKKSSSLFVIDRFSSKERLTYISNFVFDPKNDIKLQDNTVNFLNKDYLLSSPQKIILRSKNNDKFNWYSSEFNQYENTNRVFLSSNGNFDTHIITIKKNDIKHEANVLKNHIELKINNESYFINIGKIERW